MRMGSDATNKPPHNPKGKSTVNNGPADNTPEWFAQSANPAIPVTAPVNHAATIRKRFCVLLGGM